MALTGPLVLPAGCVLQPVTELPEAFRRDIEPEEGDFVISRPNSRAQAKVIDSDSAELVSEFRKPTTIARAVARLSKSRGVRAQDLLEDALPLLQLLLGAGLLVESDSVEASAVGPSLAVGHILDGWAIVRCIQAIEDVEIYQARSAKGKFAALKIARRDLDFAAEAIAWEAAVLAGLDGAVTPRLLGSGEWNSRAYLLMEWLTGADALTACSGIRHRSDPDSRRALLRVTGAILQAYVHLHALGVIHGDVHPRNVLVDRHESVTLIDLGLARMTGNEPSGPGMRGGIGFFFRAGVRCRGQQWRTASTSRRARRAVRGSGDDLSPHDGIALSRVLTRERRAASPGSRSADATFCPTRSPALARRGTRARQSAQQGPCRPLSVRGGVRARLARAGAAATDRRHDCNRTFKPSSDTSCARRRSGNRRRTDA